MKEEAKRVVCLERFSMKEVARYASAPCAAKELGLNTSTLYQAIIRRLPAYDCYWVYEEELDRFRPTHTIWRRVRGIKIPKKLQALLDKLNKE